MAVRPERLERAGNRLGAGAKCMEGGANQPNLPPKLPSQRFKRPNDPLGWSNQGT